MQKGLKLISTFVATVILVLVTVGIGILIYSWASGYLRTNVQSTQNIGQYIVECSKVNLDVDYFKDFKYRIPITIDNTQNPNDLTDYQVLVTLNTQSLISQGKMRNDCGDIRFTDSDGITLLSYWIESGCNTTNTRIWVKIPFIPASSEKIIYLYYGNPEATSLSNLQNTFVRVIDGLVLSLPFDEGSGTIAYDYSGNGNNGTYFGYNQVQTNSTLLSVRSGNLTNVTHFFDLPSKAILSDVNLTVSFRNNTINGETVRVFVNGNYIGNLTISNYSSYTFVNILKSNFTAGALNSITYEISNSNITSSSISYLQDIGWLDGKFGKALSFDGVDDYVRTPVSFLQLDRFTLVFWAIGQDGSRTHPRFFSLGNGVSLWEHFAYQTDYTGVHYLRYQNTSGFTNTIFTLFSVSPRFASSWTMFTMVVDIPRNSLKAYTNTSLTKNVSFQYPPKPINVSFWAPVVGGVKMILDEVRIYNRALSNEEIVDLYNNYPFEILTNPESKGKTIIRKYTSPEPTISLGNEELIIKLSLINLGVDLGKRFLVKVNYEDGNALTLNLNFTEKLSSGSVKEAVLKVNPGTIKYISVIPMDISCAGLEFYKYKRVIIS